MSEKLISADELKRRLHSFYGNMGAVPYFEDLIDLSSVVDAVEVVRCKDCIHFFSIIFGSHCQLLGTQMDKDGYCSCGERREENEID